MLVGNGEQQEGILFKFEQFMDEHGRLIEDISEIKKGVESLHNRADENRLAAATVASALEKYQAETRQFEAGKNLAENVAKVKRNLMYSRLTSIVAIIISLFMAYLGYREFTKKQNTTQQAVKELQYDLAPTRSAKPDTLDPEEVIKRMK
jgi:hypothetical protein